jgi:hypothetical protein
LNIDLVQAVTRVGQLIQVHLLTGNDITGMLVSLSLEHMVLEDSGGGRTAVALSSIATVSTLSVVPTVPTASAGAPPAAATAVAVPEPSLDSVSPPIIQPTPQSAVGPVPAALPRRGDQTHDWPPVSIPSDAWEIVKSRPLALPSFEVLDESVLRDVKGHLEALRRIRHQYEYAEKVRELSARFQRSGRMAQECDQLCVREPGSVTAFRLSAYLHFLADQFTEATQRFVAASLLSSSDSGLWHDTAIAAIWASGRSIAQHALLQYLDIISPDGDPDAWSALLSLSSGSAARNLLHLIRRGATYSPATRAAVLEACHHIATRDQEAELVQESAELFQSGAPVANYQLGPLHAPILQVKAMTAVDLRPEAPRVQPRPQPKAPAARSQNRQNPYDRAKYLEHQAKDLDGAQKAYREAIRTGVNTESAVKDLAWLTRRLHGPQAALRLIEEEFSGVLPPSPQRDQILMDFYLGADRWRDALDLLEPMRVRAGQTPGQRQVVLRRICLAKMSLGLDATTDAQELVELLPADGSAMRTYAIALMRRAVGDDLDRAAIIVDKLATVGDSNAADIAAELNRIREGGGTDELARLVAGLWDERAAALTELGEYFLVNFAEAADRIREQREFAPNDIGYLRGRGEDARRKRNRDRFDAYISAAKVQLSIVPPSADATQQFVTFMCKGLSALGDSFLSSNPEVAREVYAEALACVDHHDQLANDQDFWNSIVRYVRSTFEGQQALQSKTPNLGGNTSRSPANVAVAIAPELENVPSEDVAQVFAAVEMLVTKSSFAADALIRAIERVPALQEHARIHIKDHLAKTSGGSSVERVIDAWRALAQRRQAEREGVDQRMRLLLELEIGEVSLSRACNIVQEVMMEGSIDLAVDREGLRSLLDSLQRLQQATRDPSFEEQEFRYLQVHNAMADTIKRAKDAPTRLTVGTLLPIARHISGTLGHTLERLYESREPAPAVALALNDYTPNKSNLITVQVKLSNEPGSAPVETPQIEIDHEAELPDALDVEFKQAVATVRGGESAIAMIPVSLTPDRISAGAFSLPVRVAYRTRTGEGTIRTTLAVRLAEEADFVPISPNPFSEGASGRPVTNPAMFFGRDELVRQIQTLLVGAQLPGAGIAIYGQKRAGKSSIRLHLANALMESGRVVVVDIENIGRLAPTNRGLDEEDKTLRILLWTILDTANKVVKAADVVEPVPNFLPDGIDRDAFLSSPVPVVDFISYFETFITLARNLPTWSHKPFVVMIDEFQYVSYWIDQGLVQPTFVQALKAILERRLFHLVVVGVDVMQTFIDRYANEFGVFSKQRVNYLDVQSAHDLIDLPIRIGGPSGESRYRESAIAQIVALTGGNPFYIQRFCSELVNHMNASRAPYVTQADVELVREALLAALTMADFDNLELSGDPHSTPIPAETARAVLAAIANADGAATFDDIATRCDELQLEYVLKDLEAREVVVHEQGGYRILVQLYRDWLRRRTA